MPLKALSRKSLATLNAQLLTLDARIEELQTATPKGLWLRELDELEHALALYDGRAQSLRK